MRIFLLGDSFTDNVYPDLLERIKSGYTKDTDHNGYYTKDRELSDRIEQAIRESKPDIKTISFFK